MELEVLKSCLKIATPINMEYTAVLISKSSPCTVARPSQVARAALHNQEVRYGLGKKHCCNVIRIFLSNTVFLSI